MSARVTTLALGVAAAVAVVGTWELLDRLGILSFESSAPPSEAATAWWGLATDGRLADVTAHTLRAFTLAWVLAVGGGTVVGIALGLSRRFSVAVGATFTFLRFVPPPALVPVVLILWGFSLRSEVTVAAFASAWPVIINAAAGVRETDPRLMDVGRTLRLGHLATIRKLVLPSALPLTLTGIRVATSLCLVVVITAEMIGIPRGVGYEIVRSSQSLRPADALAFVGWTGMLAAALSVVVRRTERAVLRWHPQGAD